jgi:PAS domain S-box-containing protein
MERRGLPESKTKSSSKDQTGRLEQATEEVRQKIVAYQADLAREEETLPKDIASDLERLEDLLYQIQDQAKEIENERQKLEALGEIGHVINSSLDLETVLNEVMDTIIGLTRAERGFLMLHNRQGDMNIVVARNWDRTSVEPDDFEISSTVVKEVVKTGESVHTTNAQIDPRFSEQESIVAHNLRSILCVPLKVRGKLMGVIYTDDRVRAGMFEAADLSLLYTFADQAAVALDNARLYSEATLRAEEAHALITTARSISSSLDFETVLNLIAEQARDLLHADASRIHLLDQDSNILRCLVLLDPEPDELGSLEVKMGEGLTGYVAETGRPLVVNNAATHPMSVQVLDTPEDEPECLALAPLRMRNRTMGVMTVRRIGLDHPFTQSQLDLLDAFAVQAAVAIENAHLYGQIQSQAWRLENEVAARTQDLALSEARYRALVETSLAGIFQADVDGRVVYTNQAFASMLNVPLESLLGRELWDAVGANFEQTDMMKTQYQERMEGNRPAREVFEVELNPPSGGQIPCLMAVSLIGDGGSLAQGVTGLLIDISARKALEAALRAERDRLDAILANVGDAVVVTDNEYRIDYVNPAWERLNGYSAEEAISQHTNIVLSGLNPPENVNEMWQALDSGQLWSGELINHRKDKTTYEAAITVQPIFNDAGKIISYVGVAHDISALKEIDRLKSQFVSDVSHELRTPLTNIRLYLDLLHQTDDQDKVSRYLETLTRESDRLSHLINDLLSLSRLEAGATEFSPSSIDVNHLLVALAADRNELAAQQGLELVVEADPKLPPAYSDERLLHQVFTNLLTNAMNYTPRGGTITLRTKSVSNGERVEASVEDTGIGIPAEEQPLVFERFYRGHASRATNAPGTGLGLAICKEIIDLSQGQISVASEPGKGTRMTVQLPVPPPAPQEDS